MRETKKFDIQQPSVKIWDFDVNASWYFQRSRLKQLQVFFYSWQLLANMVYQFSNADSSGEKSSKKCFKNDNFAFYILTKAIKLRTRILEFFHVKRRMFTVFSRLCNVNMFEQPKKSTVRATLRIFVKSSIQSTELKNIVLWKRTWDFDRKNLRVRFRMKGVRRLERNIIKLIFWKFPIKLPMRFAKTKFSLLKIFYEWKVVV